MFNTISWHDFLVTMAWLLAGWYCVGAWMYYRKELEYILFKSWKRLTRIESHHSPGDKNKDQVGGSIVRAQQLQLEISSLLQKAKSAQFPKEELLMALQSSLRRYPELAQPGFRVAINHYIEQESEKQSATPLSEEELRLLWTG